MKGSALLMRGEGGSREFHSRTRKNGKPRSAFQSVVFTCFLFLFVGVTSGQRFGDDFLLRESVSAVDPRTARRIFEGFESQNGHDDGIDGKILTTLGSDDDEEEKVHRCRGSTTSLSAGDATVVKSHASYGSDPYPPNYLCRWLFLPVNGCQIGLQCRLGTRRNVRRSRFEKCSGADADYLRVLGNRGAADSFYCGDSAPNATFAAGDAVALLFKSNPRSVDEVAAGSSDGGRFGSLFGLEGFNCKIVCQGSDSDSEDAVSAVEKNDEAVTDVTTATSASEAATEKPKVKYWPRPVQTSPVSYTPAKSETTQRNSCSCGETREARVICPAGHNCTTAAASSVPWQAAIVRRNKWQPYCGGSLINDRYVLTAAHCMLKKRVDDIQVVLGEHDWSRRSSGREETKYGVEKIVRHHRFNRAAQFDYDFALIKLNRRVKFNQHIRPICLPSPSSPKGDLLGMTGFASGWGVTDLGSPKAQAQVLQQVAVEMMERETCRQKYGKVNPVTDNMMCARAEGADACFGDSGGPFVMRDPSSGAWEQVGVISWGKSCADEKWPGVYANVSVAMGWISRNTRDATYCQRSEGERRKRKSQLDDRPRWSL